FQVACFLRTILDRLRTGNAFATIDRFLENIADYTSEFGVPCLKLLLVFVKVHRASAQNRNSSISEQMGSIAVLSIHREMTSRKCALLYKLRLISSERTEA